jgi:hypothetical protein
MGADLSTPGRAALSDTLANLFAKKFIARPDAKAIQVSDGSWRLHTVDGKPKSARLPWTRPDILAHIAGQRSFGHYLLNGDNTCKLFAFDIDLEKFDPDKEDRGWLPVEPLGTPMDPWQTYYEVLDLRSAWLERAHPGRTYMKYQFKVMAQMLMKAIHEQLAIPCAATYSGGKGVHVYGFTGPIPAADAREGIQIVLDSLGCFQAVRGENFYKHVEKDPALGFPNLSIETFPKQGSLEGKDLGNLMRLPLGRNLKSQDPTFFIDMTTPIAEMRPVDPEWALTTDNPWKRASGT